VSIFVEKPRFTTSKAAFFASIYAKLTTPSGTAVLISASFEMEFSEVETQYKFFNKKICPVCGNKLVPNIKRFYQGRKITSGVMDVAKRDVYRGEQYYYCENCDKNSSLLELAQSRLKNK